MPQCPVHAEEAVLGTCERCGDFVCRLDSEIVDKKRFCKNCSTKSDVDWLEAYRRELLGTRDGYAFLYGVLGPIGNLAQLGFVAWAAAQGAPGMIVPGLTIAVFLANGIAYFLGRPVARWGVIVLPLAGAGFVLAAPGGLRPQELGSLVGMNLVAFLFGIAAFASPRNKLYFRLDVTEAQLRKLYSIYKDNRLADFGFLLSLGAVLPGVGIVSLALSWIALRRVDPDARPPVGKKGRAISGIVLSIVGILVSTALVIARL